MAAEHEITRLLGEAEAGREGALDDLMRLVYDDLERLAAVHMRRELGDRAEKITLEPAGLVNEAFLRLIKQRTRYDSRGHFFAIASRLMLQVLIDHCRHRSARKRGGGACRAALTIDDGPADRGGAPAVDSIDVEDLREALAELDATEPRVADIVRMRVVWGLTNEEIAESLDLSLSTVKADWRFARAWLETRLDR